MNWWRLLYTAIAVGYCAWRSYIAEIKSCNNEERIRTYLNAIMWILCWIAVNTAF